MAPDLQPAQGATSQALGEAAQDRWWRYRCGEPCMDRYPVRCKRDLGHQTPHVGVAGAEPVVWPGEGNPVSANHAGNGHYKCWGGCGREVSDGS